MNAKNVRHNVVMPFSPQARDSKIMNKLENHLKPAPCDYFENHPEYGRHVYMAKSNQKLWPGVTTILKQWGGEKVNIFSSSAAKKAVMELGYYDQEVWKGGKYFPIPKDELKEESLKFARTFKKIKAMKGKDFYAFLKEAKGAFRRHTKEAAESGTIAHDYIEDFVCERNHSKELVAKIKKDEKAKNSLKAFDKWNKEHKVEWVASELVIGSAEYEFGGTLDAIAYVDNIPSLVDFKTSNQISPDYFLQTAAYQIALEEMGFVPLQRIILRIPKDGNDFETVTIPNIVEDFNRLSFEKEVFTSLRTVQKYDSYINNENHGVKENGKVKLDSKLDSKIVVLEKVNA